MTSPQESELLPEADAVVRHFVPCVLEAAGLKESANNLRALEPFTSQNDFLQCFEILENVQKPFERVRRLLSRIKYLQSLVSVCAAVSNDIEAFQEATERVRSVLGDMPAAIIH